MATDQFCYEVKRNDAHSAKSSRQMDRYEEWLRQYQQHVWDKFQARVTIYHALVEHELVTWRELSADQAHVLGQFHPVLSVQMDGLLRAVVVDNVTE